VAEPLALASPATSSLIRCNRAPRAAVDNVAPARMRDRRTSLRGTRRSLQRLKDAVCRDADGTGGRCAYRKMTRLRFQRGPAPCMPTGRQPNESRLTHIEPHEPGKCRTELARRWLVWQGHSGKWWSFETARDDRQAPRAVAPVHARPGREFRDQVYVLDRGVPPTRGSLL
jgi:hypothetical protein